MKQIALVTLPLLVAACDGPMTLEDYYPQATPSLCGKIFECCSEEEIEELGGGIISFSTEEQCESAYDSMFSMLSSVLDGAVEAGRMRFDDELAQECLDALGALTCEEYRSGRIQTADSAMALSGCQSPFEPLVEDGGACGTPMECISGNCEGGSFISASGNCVPIPGLGQECDGVCQPGLYCGSETGSDDFVCKAYAALGEVCDSSWGCVDGTYCEYDSGSGESRCAEPPALGAECSGSCATGSFCDDDLSPAVCVAQYAEGTACETTSECLSGICEHDLTADADLCGAVSAGGCMGFAGISVE